MMGKTGKASLKRRVSDFRADSVSMDIASAAKRILSQYEVDEVRDVSAGAATFFVWVSEEKQFQIVFLNTYQIHQYNYQMNFLSLFQSMGMIEEIENIQEQHGGLGASPGCVSGGLPVGAPQVCGWTQSADSFSGMGLSAFLRNVPSLFYEFFHMPVQSDMCS